MHSALSFLESRGPGLVMEIEKGSLVLIRERRPVLVLRNINARITAPPGEQEITFKAVTEQWGSFTLNGKYRMDEEKAELYNLSAALGRSSLSGISARLIFSKSPGFEILAGRAGLSLSELYRLLSSFNLAVPFLKNVKSITGLIDVSSLQISGPLLQPAAWRFLISGRAEDVSLASELLPAALSATGRFLAESDRLQLDGVSASLGKSSVAAVSARFAWKRRSAFEVLSGRAAVDLEEFFRWRSAYPVLRDALKEVRELNGTVRLSSMKFGGTFSQPASWNIILAGSVEKVLLDMPFFPGPVSLPQGAFSAKQVSVSFSGVQVSMLDTSVSLSGVVNGLRGGIRSADLELKGMTGKDSIAWAYTKAALPRQFMISAPLTFSDVRFQWQKTAGASLSGTLISAQGPTLSFEGLIDAPEFTIRRATVTDKDTNAALTGKRSGKSLELSFSGRLAESTLDRVFEQKTLSKGTIKGDFSATMVLDRPFDVTARGRLEGEDIVIPWGLSVPVTIDSIALQADGNIFTVSSSAMTWGDAHYSAAGTVTTSEDAFVLDMDLTADRINVAEIQKALARPRQADAAPAAPQSVHRERPAVLGVVRIKTPSLSFDRFTFSPLEAVVSLAPDEAHLAFTRAEACGFSLPGTLAFSGHEVLFAFKPAATGQSLDSFLDCLTDKDFQITGRFDLNADLRAQGKSGALLSALEGSVDFSAKEGKIYRYPLLAKIFSVLSVTEIFRGKTPDLGGSGFPYSALTVKGEIHHGVFQLEQAYLSGSSIDLIADGEVDLAAKKINLIVLVAPFSTINWIIRRIPLVGKIMGGTLISIPVKVSGDLSDPDVTFLAPSAVGKRLVKILENILKIPVEIISPILPRQKEKRD